MRLSPHSYLGLTKRNSCETCIVRPERSGCSAVNKLNAKHMQWAWASLIWIVVADGYIRLVSNGTFTDYHHIF